MHSIAINEQRGHEFDREEEGVYRRIWREKSYSTISKSNSTAEVTSLQIPRLCLPVQPSHRHLSALFHQLTLCSFCSFLLISLGWNPELQAHCPRVILLSKL